MREKRAERVRWWSWGQRLRKVLASSQHIAAHYYWSTVQILAGHSDYASRTILESVLIKQHNTFYIAIFATNYSFRHNAWKPDYFILHALGIKLYKINTQIMILFNVLLGQFIKLANDKH